MELFEAITKRHSYRGPFKDVPVPREDLRRIVEAGIHAASAKNEQVCSFVIVDDPEVLAQAAKIIDRPAAETAKAVVVCVADPRPILGEMAFYVEDCAASVSNMLLAVTALGYATVWLDGVLRVNDVAARLGTLLGIPEGLGVRIVLPIGVPENEETQKEKLPFEQRAFFNRFGG